MPLSGVVTTIWRRSGTMGRSTPGQRGHLARPRPGGVHHGAGGDGPRRRLDRGHAARLDADAGGLDLGEDLRAQAPRACGVALHHAVGIGQAVPVVPAGGDDPFQVEQRDSRRDLGRGEDARRDAQPVLQGHVVAEDGQIVLVVQQEQIAGPAQIDGLAQLLLEAFQHGQAEQRQPHVDLGAELVADAARAFAGGLHAQEGAFSSSTTFLIAACGEMIGRAGPHHPAPDDDDVGGGW